MYWLKYIPNCKTFCLNFFWHFFQNTLETFNSLTIWVSVWDAYFCCISLKIVIIAVSVLTVSYHNDHFYLKHGISFSPKFAMYKVQLPLPFPLGTYVSVESAAVIAFNSSLWWTKTSGCLLLWAILKIAGRVYYLACACDSFCLSSGALRNLWTLPCQQ